MIQPPSANCLHPGRGRGFGAQWRQAGGCGIITAWRLLYLDAQAIRALRRSGQNAQLYHSQRLWYNNRAAVIILYPSRRGEIPLPCVRQQSDTHLPLVFLAQGKLRCRLEHRARGYSNQNPLGFRRPLRLGEGIVILDIDNLVVNAFVKYLRHKVRADSLYFMASEITLCKKRR